MFLQQYGPVFYDHRGEFEIITRTLSGFTYTLWVLGFPRFTVVPVDFWKGGGVRNKTAEGGREKLRRVNIIVKLQRETV